jgi:hypothetical protein
MLTLCVRCDSVYQHHTAAHKKRTAVELLTTAKRKLLRSATCSCSVCALYHLRSRCAPLLTQGNHFYIVVMLFYCTENTDSDLDDSDNDNNNNNAAAGNDNDNDGFDDGGYTSNGPSSTVNNSFSAVNSFAEVRFQGGLRRTQVRPLKVHVITVCIRILMLYDDVAVSVAVSCAIA